MSSQPAEERSETLWEFCLRVYAAPGVAPACLELQETHDVDVPLLLFSAWIALVGVRMTPDQAHLARSWVVEWQHQVVKVLRSLRTRLKTGPAPAPSGPTETFRTTIKRVELEAEKLELETLETQAAVWRAEADRRVAPSENLVTMFSAITGQPIVSTLQIPSLSVIAAASAG